jgi:hypothetical protein
VKPNIEFGYLCELQKDPLLAGFTLINRDQAGSGN